MTLSTCKKLGVLLFTTVTLGLGAQAQIQFGVKAGLNASELNTSSNQEATISGTTQKLKNFPISGLNAGIFVHIPVWKKWSFQPELVYSNQGAEGKPIRNYVVSASETYKLNYLNLPLLVQYKLPLGFFAQTGPQIGYLLKGKINETIVGAAHTNHYNVKDQFKSTDFSWVFGAGYVSPINLGFDIRYNLGLNNINNATTAGMAAAPVQSGTIKNSSLQIGIFYIFGKHKLNPMARAAD